MLFPYEIAYAIRRRFLSKFMRLHKSLGTNFNAWRGVAGKRSRVRAMTAPDRAARATRRPRRQTTSDICRNCSARGFDLAPDHADGPGGLRVLKAGDGDRRRACLHRHGHFRDQSDAHAGADHLDQRGQRTRVQRLARRRRSHVAERQGLIAKTMSFLQQEQPHFAQRFAAGNRRALILARSDQQEIFGKQGDLGERRFGHRQGDDRRVEPAFQRALVSASRSASHGHECRARDAFA